MNTINPPIGRLFRAKPLLRTALVIVGGLSVMSCASLTNDAFVPMAISFSDGSSGTCQLSNKRMSLKAKIPSTQMIRRSDDVLIMTCKTEDGREATASVPSTIGGKIIASAVFLDLGITDSITDKHREYPASYVIPIEK